MSVDSKLDLVFKQKNIGQDVLLFYDRYSSIKDRRKQDHGFVNLTFDIASVNNTIIDSKLCFTIKSQKIKDVLVKSTKITYGACVICYELNGIIKSHILSKSPDDGTEETHISILPSLNGFLINLPVYEDEWNKARLFVGIEYNLV